MRSTSTTPWATVAGVACAIVLAGCATEPAQTADVPCGVVSVVPLVGCDQAPIIDITQVVVSQTQVAADADQMRYIVDDHASLADLESLLGNRIVGDIVEIGNCGGGGRTTVLEVTSTNYGLITVTVDTCSDSPLAHDVDELASAWIADGDLVPAS